MSGTNSQNYFEDSPYVEELTPDDFDDMSPWKLNLKHSDAKSPSFDEGCCIVLFYAPWCKFCKEVAQPYEKFAKQAVFIDVYAFNCEEYSAHIMKIKNDMPQLVKSYPTIIFYSNGEPTEQYMGERTPEKFLAAAMRVCGSR